MSENLSALENVKVLTNQIRDNRAELKECSTNFFDLAEDCFIENEIQGLKKREDFLLDLIGAGIVESSWKLAEEMLGDDTKLETCMNSEPFMRLILETQEIEQKLRQNLSVESMGAVGDHINAILNINADLEAQLCPALSSLRTFNREAREINECSVLNELAAKNIQVLELHCEV